MFLSHQFVSHYSPKETKMGRLLSFCFRTKKTVKGDARPTIVAIQTGDKIVERKLAEVDDERDFAMGRFPISYRSVQDHEDISGFLPRQCKWRRVEDGEDVSGLDAKHLRQVGSGKDKHLELCTDVPDEFEGLGVGDSVVMALGAGDLLAAMLFAKGKKSLVKVWRTPPSHLKSYRPKQDCENKDNDHVYLLEMFQKQAAPFYEFRQPDMSLVSVAVKLRLRMETQGQRIAAENRLRQWVKDQMYLFDGEEEDVNEWIEERCKILMRDDPVHAALVKEEKSRDRELRLAVESTDAWQIFEPIEGVGPRIAAGFLCIGDIRRFQVEPNFDGADTDEERQKRKNKAMQKGAAKMMAYCGLHTTANASGPDANFYRVFPRHKTGEVGNWSTELRQTFFQLAEQLNKKPKSVWGKKLLEFKDGFYQKHPYPIKCDKKLVKIFRSLELFFREKAGVHIQPANYVIDSIESLQDWFDGCCSMLDVSRFNRLSAEIEQWQEQIAKAQVEGKTVKLFTPGHLLKMAKWRTLTRFARWLFPQLVKVMGKRIENQENAA